MVQKKSIKSSKKKTPKKIKKSEIQKKLVQDIKLRQQQKLKIGQQFNKHLTEVNFRRQQAHTKMFESLALKAGLGKKDLQLLWEEIGRRRKIQRRFESRGFEKVQKQSFSLIKKEAQRRKKIRDRYWKLYRKKYKARAGNPELKFYLPIDHWTTLLELTDRGMFGGGRRRDLGEFSYDLDMNIDYDGRLLGHHFYPHAFIRTGDIENPYTLKVSQTLVLSHIPLEIGRGDFHVDEIRVDLAGVGHSRSVSGHTCPLEAPHNLWDTSELTFRVTVHQFDYDTGLFLADEVINRRLVSGSPDEDVVEEINLSTRLDARDFYVLNNGLDIYMHVDIITRVSAADEDGLAEINFSQEDTDGLYLGCTTLIGEYEG